MKKYTWDEISPTVGSIGPFYLVCDVEKNLGASLQLLEQVKQRDVRIAELDGYLRDWLRLDASIGGRLASGHNWTHDDQLKHGNEIEERAVLREQARVALGL